MSGSLIGRRFKKKARNGVWVTYQIIDVANYPSGKMIYSIPDKGREGAFEMSESLMVRAVKREEIELIVDEDNKQV